MNLKKLQTFDSSLFTCQSYFSNDGAQLYLIFQVLYYTLKRLDHTENIVSWKSEDLSSEKLTTSTTTDNSLSLSISWYANSHFCLAFKGNYLKQKTATYTLPNKINILYCL